MADAPANLPLGEALLEVVKVTASHVEKRADSEPWHSDARARHQSRLAEVIALEVAEAAARSAAARPEARGGAHLGQRLP